MDYKLVTLDQFKQLYNKISDLSITGDDIITSSGTIGSGVTIKHNECTSYNPSSFYKYAIDADITCTDTLYPGDTFSGIYGLYRDIYGHTNYENDFEYTMAKADSELSSSSTNYVQNKVIKAALDNKANNTIATTSSNGLMSTTDKFKLDHLPTLDGSIKTSWTWGTLLTGNDYTQKFTWDEAGGGSVAFAAKGGQTSMQIDGRYYDQEGKYALIDTNDLSTTLASYSKNNHTHTISNITDISNASVASATYASNLGSSSGSYTYTTLNNKFADYTKTTDLPKVIR